jgi:hypothetical protein
MSIYSNKLEVNVSSVFNVKTLVLTGPTTVKVNTPVTYTATAYDANNNPVLGATVFFFFTNSESITDANGQATTTVTFPTTGTWKLQAQTQGTYKVVFSNTLVVEVTS